MPTPIDPRRTALLLMDLQVRILGLVGDDTGEFVARAVRARAAAREAGMRVGHVRVAFTDADYAAIPERNKGFSALASVRVLAEGTPDAQIHPDLVPAEDEDVVTKTRTGAFSTTRLEEVLRGHGVDTLVLAGIATSGVVLSTLRDAADRDYRLLVLSDVCADQDPEVHRVLTEKVFPRQADVLDLAAFESLLGGS